MNALHCQSPKHRLVHSSTQNICTLYNQLPILYIIHIHTYQYNIILLYHTYIHIYTVIFYYFYVHDYVPTVCA